MRRALVCGALLALTACAPLLRPPREAGKPTADTLTRPPVTLRRLILIHGDGDYLYHDSTGRRLWADQEILQQALDEAREDAGTETFIFHQKRVRAGFWGPRFDGTVYLFRQGRLITWMPYRRTPNDFEAEAALVRRLGADSGATPAWFEYFGHEIPLRNRGGYSASHPAIPFSADDFGKGLDRLSPRPFDLVVLSSCYGGNPVMMRELEGRARYVVASPAYLHLTNLDVRARGARDPESTVLRADSIARRSFERLKDATGTEITVGVYDLEKLRAFLNSPWATSQSAKSAGTGAWKDCANDPAFDSRAAAAGTVLYYQPPRFGPLKARAARSAWQCRL